MRNVDQPLLTSNSVNSEPPADQQPDWPDRGLAAKVRDEVGQLPPLVAPDEVDALAELLAEVAAGRARVVQAGDCAEDPAECTPHHLAPKADMLWSLADRVAGATGQPVVPVGRIAGQFAKPRSASHERIGAIDLPVYRGSLVNGPEPDAASRCPDPLRMLAGYQASAQAMRFLATAGTGTGRRVWTSHEALILDYESALVRHDGDGRRYLTSTHWPWLGDRTRHLDGPHVAFLAAVRNPLACKVGPGTDAAELVALCDRLDPRRQPGRLTLIARLGADAVADRLPPLARAVRLAGHPVIWLCDPMHGNTVRAADGRKTRLVRTVLREVAVFQEVLTSLGVAPGGLHLETTPAAVDECVTDQSQLDRVGLAGYTTLCDPRLNPEQAETVVSAWRS
ncbi:3-deoxy-7-phosphoheptulonate synthase [Micromonospora sp. NPDC093277]|uniref:3-deoxy-7-phosphoheptulonate synthase n=1 Tax=Micromonospora sp. NPDC093277 TaxID=3364291 RepID=UPI0038093330